MNVYFQTRNIEVSPYEKEFMANRMHGLDKFFSWDTHCYVDIEKTRASHNGHDLYYISIKIDDVNTHYFTEEYRENIRKAFDYAYGEIFRIVRDERSRSRTLMRKAGKRIKNIFKRY